MVSTTDITNLSTFVQASVGKARRLITLTNLGVTNADSVRTAYLEQKCKEAIWWFQNEAATYNGNTADPDNWHPQAAYFKVMQLLYIESDDKKKAAAYESDLAPFLQRMRASRTIGVETNSLREEDEEPTGKLPFNEDFWDGVLPDAPGGDNY